MLPPERLAEMTARLAEITVRHQEDTYPGCAYCGQSWPCDAIQALTAYEQAQRRLAWLEEGKMLLINVQENSAEWRKLKVQWLAAEKDVK